MEQPTKELLEQAKTLYNKFKEDIKGLKSEDEIYWKIRHISAYEMVDTFDDEYVAVNIATDNNKKNTLQGIRVYINVETLQLSRYIDLYLCDDEYPFEDVDVEKYIMRCKMAKRNQLAVIHILKKEYNISEDEYRKMLEDRHDVESSAFLSEEQAEDFIHYIKYTYSADYKLGFDKGIEVVMPEFSYSTEIYKRIVQMAYNRPTTSFEDKMFEIMTFEQRKNLLSELKKEIKI